MSNRSLVVFEPGAVFVGRYRVEALLAQGGMGAVYKVVQVSNGARRALKVLHPDVVNIPSVRAGFEREARVGANIRSANVVEVVDAGIDDSTGMPWLAMELLTGETLEALVKREGPQSPETVIRVFDQVGDAVGAAHDAGVVHMDLKPENVFLADLALHGVKGPVVKVLDFGIARVVASDATSAQITTSGGSPYWMAPEQAEGKTGRARPSTDVWPLGLMAYRLLTGRYFWREAGVPGATLRNLLTEILFKPLPRASVRAAEQGVTVTLPPDFDTWFSHCVERDHTVRFQNARAAVEALRQVLAPPAIPPTLVAVERGPVDPRAGTVIFTPTAAPAVAAEVARSMALMEQLAQAENRGQLGETVRLGEEALALRPTDEALRRRLAAHYGARARTFASLGERDKAVMDATRATELDPQSAAWFALRGELRLARGDVGPALDDLTRAVNLDVTRADAWALRGRCHLQVGRPGDALRDLDTAIGRAPTVAEYWHHRGLAWRALGDAARSQADLARATALGYVATGR